MIVLEQFRKLLENFSSLKNFKNITIEKEEDISNIPFTTRDDLTHFSISDCPVRPQGIYLTSGTTGRNIFVYFSKEAEDMIMQRIKGAFNIFHKGDILLNLFDYSLGGAGIIIHKTMQEMGYGVAPIGSLNNPQKIAITLKMIENVKPVALLSFPNQVYNIFKDIPSKNSLKYCIIGGEPLLSPLRSLIESKGCSIVNAYGCNEIGFLAFNSTPRTDGFMELLDEEIYVEVLDKEGKSHDSGEGELILTDLNNYSSPIIRYRVGDFVNIKKENGKKFIIPKGRLDNFTKIQGEITSIGKLITDISTVVDHPNFCVHIDKKYTHDDDLLIMLQKEDKSKEDELRKLLNEQGLYPRFSFTSLKVSRTNSGKFIHFIDKRKIVLEDKSLNW